MQSTPELTNPPQVPRPYQADEVSFADIVRFCRRNFLLIAGPAFVVGVLTVAAMLLFVGRSYEASAVLVIVPPKYSSDLKTGGLTVQGYQKLLESDAVMAETRKRLIARGVLKPEGRLEVGREVETKIFVSRQREENTLAPMLQIIGRGDSPENAALTTNTWAEVFLERTKDLVRGSTSSTVQFVEQQYPQARDDLAKVEDERNGVANDCQKRQDETANRWDATVSTFKNETADLLAAFRAETRRMTESLRAGRSLDTKKTRLDSLRKAFGDQQEEQARVNSLLEQRKLEQQAVQAQLEKVKQFLAVRKSITDDTLWQVVAGAQKEDYDWSKLGNRVLVSEELNPEFTELRSRLTKIETDVNALTPRAAQLGEMLSAQAQAIAKLEETYRQDLADLEKLEREREAGQTKLEEDRARQLTVLIRASREELDSLKRECDTKLAQLDRDAGQKKDLFGDLAKNYTQALLAKAQENAEDVRLGAPATPPDRPKARGTLIRALLASIVAGMLGLGVALVREVSAT